MIRHLTRTDHNDRVELLEIDQSLPSPTVEAALTEWQALTSLTQSKKSFYEASINPQIGEELTKEQWIACVDILEEKLGFQGQPRLIIQHEKKGRTHVHVVWQSVIVDEQKIVLDRYNYVKHELAQIEIEEKYDLKRSKRKFIDRDQEEEYKKSYTRTDQEKAARSGIDPQQRIDTVTKLYHESKDGAAFSRALEQEGYYLARGDKRNIFMVIDPGLEAYTLADSINGAKASDVKHFLAPMKVKDLIPVQEALAELNTVPHQPDQKINVEAEYISSLKDRKEQYTEDRRKLDAKHYLENKAYQEKLEQQKPTGFRKLLEDISGIAWLRQRYHEREMREQLAQQKIESDNLVLNYEKDRAQIGVDRRQALSKLDEVHREQSDGLPRFFASKEQVRRNELVDALNELEAYDQSIMTYDSAQNEMYRKKTTHENKIEKLEALEAETLETCEAMFKDGSQAVEAMSQRIEEDGLNKTIRAIREQPWHFGDLNNPMPTGKAHLEQVVQLEQLAKTRRYQHNLGKQIENQQKEYESTCRSLSFYEHRRLELKTDPPVKRLALMLDVVDAARNLSDKDWKSLSQQDQQEIRHARQMMKDKKNREDALAYQSQYWDIQPDRER